MKNMENVIRINTDGCHYIDTVGIGKYAKKKEFVCYLCGQSFDGYANRYITHMESVHGFKVTKKH